MRHPFTYPIPPSSTGEDTSLFSKALRDLSGATSLKDERVGHYLAPWVLSYPLVQRQFSNAIQYVNTATSTKLRVRHARPPLRHTPPPYSPPLPCVNLRST